MSGRRHRRDFLLDSGAVSGLAADMRYLRAYAQRLEQAFDAAFLVPQSVLVEVVSGRRDTDVPVERLLNSVGPLAIRVVAPLNDDALRAGILRGVTRRRTDLVISVVDALVVAIAEKRSFQNAVTILTGDPDDIHRARRDHRASEHRGRDGPLTSRPVLNHEPMSWDIYVQDLPPVSSVSEIPGDWSPMDLGSRTAVVAAIQGAAPNVDFSDPTWGRIEGDGYSIEVNLSDEDPVPGFAFHVRGGEGAIAVIAGILHTGGWRALDPSSDSGFFDPADASASLEQWRRYRDQVIDQQQF